MKGFRRPLLRGLAGLLPAILTIVVVVMVYNFLYHYAGKNVNRFMEYAIHKLGAEKCVASACESIDKRVDGLAPGAYEQVVIASDDPKVAPKIVREFHFRPLTGLIASVILIYVFGLLLSSFLGRILLPYLERVVLRVPVIRTIYPHAKQLTDFLFAERTLKYRGVVALEYPRKGIYQIGLITNVGMKDVVDKTGRKMLVVFVPTSPTPVTGYTVIVAEEDVIMLDLPLEQAFRFIVSGGVLMPDGQMIPGAKLPDAIEVVPPEAEDDGEDGQGPQ